MWLCYLAAKGTRSNGNISQRAAREHDGTFIEAARKRTVGPVQG